MKNKQGKGVEKNEKKNVGKYSVNRLYCEGPRA